jgi:hypothetical protein
MPYDSHAFELGKGALLGRANLSYIQLQKGTTFTLEDAIDLMHTVENPNLRNIAIGKQQFKVSLL